MAEKLDINVFNDKCKCIRIGKLTKEMINFLKNNSKDNNIVDKFSSLTVGEDKKLVNPC